MTNNCDFYVILLIFKMEFVTKGGGIGGRGAIAPPPLFQICELGGLDSRCVNL